MLVLVVVRVVEDADEVAAEATVEVVTLTTTLTTTTTTTTTTIVITTREDAVGVMLPTLPHLIALPSRMSNCWKTLEWAIPRRKRLSFESMHENWSDNDCNTSNPLPALHPIHNAIGRMRSGLKSFKPCAVRLWNWVMCPKHPTTTITTRQTPTTILLRPWKNVPPWSLTNKHDGRVKSWNERRVRCRWSPIRINRNQVH